MKINGKKFISFSEKLMKEIRTVYQQIIATRILHYEAHKGYKSGERQRYF